MPSTKSTRKKTRQSNASWRYISGIFDLRIQHATDEGKMAPPRRSTFFRRLCTFHVKQERIVQTVFLLVCLVAVYLLLMSFILMSEVHDRYKLHQKTNILKSNIHQTMFHVEDLNISLLQSGTIEYENGNQSTTALPPTEEPLKTILFWNPFFTDWEYHFGLGRRPFLRHKCAVSTCQAVNNKSYLTEAEAVIFHTPEIGYLPSFRPPSQKYIFLQREPHYPKSKQLLNSYYDLFNLTISYRFDSDIVIPYGQIVLRTNQSEAYNQYPPESKTAQIVWVVSHCNSLGRREMYMDELMKYADVDIYGDCGNLTCEKSDVVGCYHKFETQYRYYIAFENTYCKDYVSEKLFRSLLFDMVPIVYGKANYSGLSPPHSVIDIHDFPHPKSLAEYLWYLNENPVEYSKYFRWKATHEIIQSREEIFAPAFCRLCEILHDPGYQYQDYKNISSWWLGGSTCELGYMAKLRKNHHWGTVSSH